MSQWPTLDDMQFTQPIEQTLLYTNSSMPLIANTYPDFSQIIASTAQDSSAILIIVHYNVNDVYELDVAIGDIGSEQIICEKLITEGSGGAADSARWSPMYLLPVTIPAGSRLSFRCKKRDVAEYDDIYVQYLLLGSSGMGSASYSVCERIGEATVDCGGVVHTKGSYGEAVASTANDYKAIMIKPFRADTTHTDVNVLYDVAIGTAASEQIILPDQYARDMSSSDVFMEFGTPVLPLQIPAGTRISARGQCSSTSTSYRTIQIPLWGFR